MNRFAFCCILAILFISSRGPAQELNCTVTLENLEQLSAESRENIQDFARELEQYLNNQRWTKEDYGDYRIKCALTIMLNGQSSQNYNHYVAQAVINTQRPINKANKNTAVLRILDDKWEFDYIRYQPIQRDEYRFDPLLSFLDYYAYVIIGYDSDTYGIGQGTPYFERAYEIVNRARSGGSNKGWDSQSENTYSRQKLVEELLSPKLSEFRSATYRYYFKGLDYLSQKPEKGQKTILSALKTISELQRQINQQSLIINYFFDMKAPEIAEIFKDVPDAGIFDELVKYDPKHRTTYEAAFRR